jgi:hypothetical protein
MSLGEEKCCSEPLRQLQYTEPQARFLGEDRSISFLTWSSSESNFCGAVMTHFFVIVFVLFFCPLSHWLRRPRCSVLAGASTGPPSHLVRRARIHWMQAGGGARLVNRTRECCTSARCHVRACVVVVLHMCRPAWTASDRHSATCHL